MKLWFRNEQQAAPSIPGTRQAGPDILRGLAACVVLIHHFLLIFYPALFTTLPEHAHTPDYTEAGLAYSPISFLWNGHFAVSIFFVLSGYVLSLPYFANHDHASPGKNALQRYPRLILPVAASVLIAWILLRANAFSNISIAQVYTKNEFWFTNLWRIQPGFFDALYEAFLQAPFYGDTFEYNPVLWTITVEFLGSLLVFALLALTGSARNRVILYIVIAALLYKSHLMAFVVGTALADYRYSRFFRSLNRYAVPLVMLCGLHGGSFHWIKFLNPGEWGVIMHMTDHLARNVYTISAALLLLGTINRTEIRFTMPVRLGSGLGKISYGVYLLHLIVIGTFSCWMFQQLSSLQLSYHQRVVLTFFGTCLVTFTAAYLFYRLIDRPAIRFARYIAGIAFHQKTDSEIQRNC